MNLSGTIKICYENMSEETALELVRDVTHGGRISKTKHGDSYCFCSVREHERGKKETIVYADRTRTMDTFRVTSRWKKFGSGCFLGSLSES